MSLYIYSGGEEIIFRIDSGLKYNIWYSTELEIKTRIVTATLLHGGAQDKIAPD